MGKLSYDESQELLRLADELVTNGSEFEQIINLLSKSNQNQPLTTLQKCQALEVIQHYVSEGYGFDMFMQYIIDSIYEEDDEEEED